ncbi:NAD(P)H-dependent oxidoreductase [Paenibacillus piri]|uniref:Flavoprotein n=1 Tax=Paenibacillus piri TaxID=2547395 RepID=A0A4R5KXI3_9BACL|nr:NAD(P)H-dependent oxidoreductase [Paenibacillus piri]TDG00537.1 flavoprotein [Paenibacillus piri]
MANILVVYYSAFGHVFQMAQAVAEGANREPGSDVRIVRIAEMASPANRVIGLDRERGKPSAEEVSSGQAVPAESERQLSGRFRLQDRYAKYEAVLELQNNIPIATNEDLRWADGILWGFPTYYGTMPAQVKLFLEFAGELCIDGALEGKPAGIFNSTASIHTGHEAAILTSMVPLFHFGMIFVGLPYTENPEYLTADPIGCSPYGASTLAGPDSSLQPDRRELTMASRLGERVAHVAAALALHKISQS